MSQAAERSPLAASEGGDPGQGASGGARGLVAVLFKGRRVECFSNPEAIALSPGMMVLVEVERGEDMGEVLLPDAPAIGRRRDGGPRRIIRAAREEEIHQLEILRAQDQESLETVKQRVEHFRLPMHLIDAEHQYDRNRVTFYFTAEHRVDFRELVRDLAGIFRTRIELRQIGTREAARRIGGLGPCGRCLCCSCHMWDFGRVTLQMARDQKLSISPSRLSGVCGRLLCCLTYEDEGELPDSGLPPGCPLGDDSVNGLLDEDTSGG